MTAPDGASLSFTAPLLSASPNLIIADISYVRSFEPFDRPEFSFAKLKDARASTGERRILIEMLGGKPAQILTDCVSNTAVPLIPETDTVFNQEAQMFIIDRYTVQGAISTAADVNSLLTIHQNHTLLLAQFQAHQKRATWDTSYEALIALQSDTLSYLTTTGVTASGSCLESSLSNVLITSLNINNAFSIPNSLGGNTFYKTYSVTFEQRTISSLASYSPL